MPQSLHSEECAVASYLALFFLSFFAFCVALGWLNQSTPMAFWSRQLAFPMAVIGAVVVAVVVNGARKNVVLPLLGLLVLGGLLYISSWFLDLSWDGLAYPQRAIIALLKGVNFLSVDRPTGDLWVDNYTKATWYYGATLVSWFGRTESGASYHFVLGAAAVFYLYGFCRESGRGRLLSSILTIIAFCNPVTLVQWFTYYNDAALGSLGILIFLSAILTVRQSRLSDRVVFVASTVLAVNVKASGIILVGAAFLYLGLALLWQTRSVSSTFRKVGVPFAVFCALGIGVLGYSPYVQNLVHDRHIFYPLVGEGKADIMTSNSPYGFPEKNRFHTLFLSIFSKSEDMVASMRTRAPSLKIPGVVYPGESAEFWRTDTRIGGFGPLYSLALVLGLLSLLVLHVDWKIVGPLGFLIVVAVVVNPYAWWARYSPILWLLPIVPLIGMKGARFRFGYLIPLCTVLAMAINIVLVMQTWIQTYVVADANVKRAALALQGKKLKVYQSYFASDMLIERLGLKFEAVDKKYYELNKDKFIDLTTGISYERD